MRVSIVLLPDSIGIRKIYFSVIYYKKLFELIIIFNEPLWVKIGDYYLVFTW